MGLLVSASDIKAAVLVAEGLFPIATKLLDEIRHWKIFNLFLKLHDPASKAEVAAEGQGHDSAINGASTETTQTDLRHFHEDKSPCHFIVLSYHLLKTPQKKNQLVPVPFAPDHAITPGIRERGMASVKKDLGSRQPQREYKSGIR